MAKKVVEHQERCTHTWEPTDLVCQSCGKTRDWSESFREANDVLFGNDTKEDPYDKLGELIEKNPSVIFQFKRGYGQSND